MQRSTGEFVNVDGDLTARDLAARHWFGYGRWDASYWFVGMEFGGDDDPLSYESWLHLAGPKHEGLIDCKEHHDEWNRRLGRHFAQWHDDGVPPIQDTWGPLIRLLLAFQQRPNADGEVAEYQRESWGRRFGDSALIELSAIHARNMSVRVERTLHRVERIAEMRKQLRRAAPRFAVFYGRSYKAEYERIAGPFNTEGWTWCGPTLCLLVVHPAYRYAPGPDYWRTLGKWIGNAMRVGKGSRMPSCPQPPPPPKNVRRNGKPSKRRFLGENAATLEGDEFNICRGDKIVGRVLYNGWHLRVERRLPDGRYSMLGRYESCVGTQLVRKLREIDAIFDAWNARVLAPGDSMKASWRRSTFVPSFDAPSNCITIGCAVVEQNRIPVAHVYKTKDGSAVWRDLPRAEL